MHFGRTFFMMISLESLIVPKIYEKKLFINNHISNLSYLVHYLLKQRRRHQCSSHKILGGKPQVPYNDLENLKRASESTLIICY